MFTSGPGGHATAADAALSSVWFAAAAIGLGLFLQVVARRLAAGRSARLRRVPGATFGARLQEPLPGAVEIVAAAGQARAPRLSGDAIVMRTTPGVRLVAGVIAGAILWLLYGPSHGTFMPSGWPTAAAAAVTLLSVAATFSFEARVDADRLVIVHMLHWRRDFRWRDLRAIRDDGGYSWRLDFATGRARLPKHLVGMPGFLSLVAEHLDRNAALHARTARG